MSGIVDNSTPRFLSDRITSQSEEDKTLIRNLPGINLPEQILLVIDTVRERDCTPFKLTKGTNYMPLFMIKRVVEHFICIKSTIQRNHEYALMILNSQSAEWICDFTDNINSIIDSLDVINEEIIEAEVETAEDEEEEEEVEEHEEGEEEEEEEQQQQQQRKDEETVKANEIRNGRGKRERGEREEKEKKEEEEKEDEKSYDLGQLFDKIEQKLLLSARKGDTIVPKYVTRVILLYSRSTSIPKFDSSKVSLDNLTKNPYFFVDVLYVHEPPCSKNLCEEIYSEIARLDTKNVSYILEVGRNAAKLHDNMAKLLAHPLQRPQQKDVCYAIYPFSASQEAYINV
ncbi:BRISC and BRCA1-A complex member 1 [Megachile rotundata]|uniref:BRISC and BRCA1-A complex member 1 n=1 Tax=Megachile rotundata TaxID=143995 RepID=UPI000614D387|nr:PREDICTED: neurofilament medium polypeptide-like [Megachile rotundata]